MKKTRRNWKKIIARFLVIAIVLTCVPIYNCSETKAAGYVIANNGTGGININISAAPYNERWNCGDPYGKYGCTWFVGLNCTLCQGQIF